MVLAQAWQRQLDIDAAESRADLGHQLGVSRAHVAQILRFFRLAPGAKQAVVALGGPTRNTSPSNSCPTA